MPARAFWVYILALRCALGWAFRQSVLIWNEWCTLARFFHGYVCRGSAEEITDTCLVADSITG